MKSDGLKLTDAFKTIRALNPIDGLRVRPIIPLNFKPQPAVTIGAVIGTIVLIGLAFAGG